MYVSKSHSLVSSDPLLHSPTPLRFILLHHSSYPTSFLEPQLITPRPPNDQHKPRPPAPCLLRLPLRPPNPKTPPSTTRNRKNNLPRSMDKYMLFASIAHDLRT